MSTDKWATSKSSYSIERSTE